MNKILNIVFYNDNVFNKYNKIIYDNTFYHGVYVSFVFLKWIIVTTYTSLLWILSYIPKPSLQLTDKELYNEIEIGDYIMINDK